MKREDHRARLRRATRRAQERSDRARAEIERREDSSPRPGDLLGFVETAKHSVLWAVLESDSTRDPQRFLVTAADLHPFIGSRDVAIPPESACGAMSLRCDFHVWLDATDLDSARSVGMLGADGLAQAHRKWLRVAARSARSARSRDKPLGSERQRDTDSDPIYLDWLREGPARAQAALLESVGRNPE